MDDVLIKYFLQGSPSAVVLAFGIIWIRGKFILIEKNLNELKTDKTWTSVCQERHVEIERRLIAIEKKIYKD